MNYALSSDVAPVNNPSKGGLPGFLTTPARISTVILFCLFLS